MNSFRKIACLALLLAVGLSGFSQETVVTRDLHLWTGARIEKTFKKDWTLSLEEEIRFKTKISEINNFYTELGLRYRINKNFTLGGAFRYTSDKNEDQSYESLFRYHFDLRYKGRLEFMTVNYRFRYQREVEGFQLFSATVPNEKLFRNRLGIQVPVSKKVRPFATAELFQEISPYVFPQFLYWRLVFGVILEPGDLGEFKLGWGFNRELEAFQPSMIYMFRVNYTYEF